MCTGVIRSKSWEPSLHSMSLGRLLERSWSDRMRGLRARALVLGRPAGTVLRKYVQPKRLLASDYRVRTLPRAHDDAAARREDEHRRLLL